MDLLVSTDRLAAMLGAPDLRILDATYHALEPERDPRADFAAGYIPGARFLDLATLADADDPRPGMAPSAGAFAARLAALGVAPGDRILLYDQAPHHTAARAWWLTRLFGVARVSLLDGGLAKWRREGRPMDTGPDAGGAAREAMALAADPARVRTEDQLLANLDDAREQVLDARSATRFTGAEADPRGGVAPGHIPGSRNLPYSALFAEDGTWLKGDALRAAFASAGIDLGRPVVTTCGSGVTAAVLSFGLALLGRESALYDGSWSEWGADPATPKALGA